jgi:hypothetical protein
LESAPAYAFFHDRGLKIELHPGCDRCSYNADYHEQVSLVAEGFERWRLNRGDGRIFPQWMRQHPSEDVSDVEKRRREEDFFNRLILAFHHNQPDDHRANRHGDVARETK